MSFEQQLKEINSSIERGYLDLVVNSYRPLFEIVKKRAVEHMKSENITEINLGVHSGLFFRKDGEFWKEGRQVELRELPNIYQEESDYNAACSDDRHNVTPSVHRAMNSALSNFREKVKKSLADII